jgi:protein arginine kinase activator
MSHPVPKKCAACGQTAKVFVSFVANGKVISEAWCETHADTEGLADPQGYNLTEERADSAGRRGEATVRCPVCDCSQRDFERQGRFGCSNCYSTFAGLLSPLLNRMHRDVKHRGKIPQRGADSVIVRHRLALLQTELSNAVRAEEFEGAAQTRDAIEALKAKLLSSGALPSEENQTPNALPPGP